MVASKLFIASLVAAVSGTVALAADDVFATLLKRQQPGTPAYNCHDNCGTAISLAKQPNPCTNDAFKTDYNNCLQCAGSGNYNIWSYYGGKLSAVGSTCAFDTQPKSGKQPDVGPAVHAGGSSSAAPAGSATSAPSSGAATPPASVSMPALGAPTDAPTAPVLSQSSAAGVPSQAPNGTAPTTPATPPQQSGNAGARLDAADAAGLLGAIVAGALFGM